MSRFIESASHLVLIFKSKVCFKQIYGLYTNGNREVVMKYIEFFHKC